MGKLVLPRAYREIKNIIRFSISPLVNVLSLSYPHLLNFPLFPRVLFNHPIQTGVNLLLYVKRGV